MVLVNFVHASDSGGGINAVGAREPVPLVYVAIGMAGVVTFSVAVAFFTTKKD